ncbi:uncharacterized protein N7483_005980 [Penicillium malachiteum]|uniref:uncharacterized protein n=1 Tax=Penicillium malachiteum TaxID=1324776 RepID=UPI0025492256|nr:uncharacterized protein N7483_005980 [Penicillium malachiteum]KAJ5731472.1 hypothetical protein N7483_005980 [Penicillium malachiteum]
MKQMMLLAHANGEEKCQFESTSSNNALSKVYLNRQEQVSIMGRYRSYIRWLGRTIEFSLNMTTGAGIFKISPSLKVQTVFSYGRPEYRYVSDLLQSLWLGLDFDNDFQRLKNSLSERRFALSCAVQLEYNGGTKSLFEEFSTILAKHAILMSNDLQRRRIVEFLLAVRTESDNSDCPMTLGISPHVLLKAADIPIIAHLAKIGFSFDFSKDWHCYTKDNLVLLLPLLDSGMTLEFEYASSINLKVEDSDTNTGSPKAPLSRKCCGAQTSSPRETNFAQRMG